MKRHTVKRLLLAVTLSLPLGLALGATVSSPAAAVPCGFWVEHRSWRPDLAHYNHCASNTICVQTDQRVGPHGTRTAWKRGDIVLDDTWNVLNAWYLHEGQCAWN